MKFGIVATKDMTDLVKETALIQENNSKVNVLLFWARVWGCSFIHVPAFLFIWEEYVLLHECFFTVLQKISESEKNDTEWVDCLQAYAKLSKQLGSSPHVGSFAPMLLSLKTMCEKLSGLHGNMVTKVR